MAAQMKQMGFNPAEFAGGSTYDDPELAELDRQMQAQERGEVIDDEAAMLAQLDKELGLN